jgi:hypothetical protein
MPYRLYSKESVSVDGYYSGLKLVLMTSAETVAAQSAPLSYESQI